MNTVDIIMPAYNCEKYVKLAIESVKKQTFKNWNLIIIEDVSTDQTLQIIEESIEDIKNKVLLIKAKEHLGVAEVRNLGIEKSTNRFVSFLDADDLWDEDKLKRQVRFMEENKYGFTYTSFYYLKNSKIKTVKYMPDKLDYNKALGNTFILTSTVLIDTKIIDRKYLKMPNVGSEDTATWWQILKAGNIAYGLKENLTTYRVTKSSLSASKLESIKRTWKLYRKIENLKIIQALYYFIKYIFHATTKRI